MIEIPEAYTLAKQIKEVLVGKTIKNVLANAHPHSFAQYTGNPDDYQEKLKGKKITDANPGVQYTSVGNIEIICEDMLLVISTPIKYHAKGEKLPAKHQLLIEFEDASHMSCTVQMWGSMFCYPKEEDGLPDNYVCNKAPSPLSDEFDYIYFEGLWNGVKPNLSVKAFLATEQRIPGLGNGVLQDILFKTRVNPRKKLQDMEDIEKKRLYESLKRTLSDMASQGGRDTEKDLFGHSGGYKTILSSKTLKNSCPICGNQIIRESYLGGNIYYCPICQPYKKGSMAETRKNESRCSG